MEGSSTTSHSSSALSDDVSECNLLNFDLSRKTSSDDVNVHFDESLYTIHRYVYEGDNKSLSTLLFRRDKSTDVSRQDMHGNTALHLAAMLGRKECAELLLAFDAPVDVKNLQGQTPLNEAISFGNRKMIITMVHRLRAQTTEHIESHQPAVQKALEELDDFRLTLKWEFHSWVPLVSRFLPCDTCHIYKKGCHIRMDTTLIDFKDMRWERGNLSFLFDGTKLGTQSLLVMDHKQKVFQWIKDESEEILVADVDIMMSTDNETGKLTTKNIAFTRAQSGIIFKEGKTEMVGECKADFFNVQGIRLVSVKRREHLSDEDIKANKSKLNHANIQKALADGPESTEFPVTVAQLLTVLESIKPLRHFKKLREFMAFKLPPGFPVKLEIPVFPTVTAKVAFEQFEWKNDLDDTFFEVPAGYEEDAERFGL
ncbi:hypothetical protein EB796_016370 [Bugula neritina]|uniref:Ankyrin repeat domain-containing protein n=1 Tax=Bugula neritina TaxID=10212 RepID=A0A7J7JGT5_BUGNE|nr:hypothetical protein EB796_016370 [Bugula neritina]